MIKTILILMTVTASGYSVNYPRTPVVTVIEYRDMLSCETAGKRAVQEFVKLGDGAKASYVCSEK